MANHMGGGTMLWSVSIVSMPLLQIGPGKKLYKIVYPDDRWQGGRVDQEGR